MVSQLRAKSQGEPQWWTFEPCPFPPRRLVLWTSSVPGASSGKVVLRFKVCRGRISFQSTQVVAPPLAPGSYCHHALAGGGSRLCDGRQRPGLQFLEVFRRPRSHLPPLPVGGLGPQSHAVELAQSAHSRGTVYRRCSCFSADTSCRSFCEHSLFAARVLSSLRRYPAP